MRQIFLSGVRHALVVVLGIIALTMAGPSASHAEPATKAVDRFASCVASSGQADIVILMDESGSLAGADGEKPTDPNNDRLTATKFFLTRLAMLTSDGSTSIEVRLAGFANDYRPVTGWQGLTKSSLTGLLRQVDGYGTDGSGTDYWLGLDGARRDLLARAAARPNACRAVVFFSDGKLDIKRASTESDYRRIDRPYAERNRLDTEAAQTAAKEAATESLCRKGGLADQLRKRGIVLFGIGLAPDGKAGDFDLMRQVTTGADGCGAITKPVPGDFTTAKNIDDLLFAFERAKPGSGVEGTAPVCRGEFCEQGAHRFVLDATVSRVNILGTAPVPGVEVYLRGPEGKPVRLARAAAGEATPIPLRGAQGSYQWESDQTLSVALRAADAKLWTGQWQVAFVSPTASSERSRTRIEVTGDLRPVWEDAAARQQLRQGGTVPLRVGVERETGARIGTKDVLGSLDLAVDLVTSDGNERALGRISKEELGRDIPLDADALPLGPATLRLTLQVTTAGIKGKNPIPGTQLAPVVREYPVTVLPPPSFPTVPAVLDFGVLDGTADTTATLTVAGPGCVWVKTDQVVVDTAPEESGTVRIDADQRAPESCVSAAAGQTTGLNVRLRVDSAGNGMVSGTLLGGIASADDPRQNREVPIAFTAELRKPLNQVNYWSALLVAVILGVGLPIGIVYAMKYLLNSKIPAGVLHAVSCDIELTEEGAVLRNGEPLSVSGNELAKLVDIPRGGARRLQVSGIELVSRLGWSPFGAAQVEVRTPGVASGSSYRLTPTPGRTWLPLAIADSWVVMQPASGQVRLLMLIGGATARTPDRLRSFLVEVSAGVPTVLGRRTTSTSTAGRTPDDPRGERRTASGRESRSESGDPWGEPMRPSERGGPNGPRGGGTREPDPFDDDPFA